mmetsp:Transcript_40356/g.34094  ORF Transcript_40356/g.34094 Transcript_40356/m.34094 type:complete len:129 (+) Transcript_40356:480-866(+)
MGMCGQSNPMPQPPLVCVECVNGVSVHHVCECSVRASHVHKPLHKTRIMCLLPLTLHSTSPACRATVLPSPVHRLSSSFRVPRVVSARHKRNWTFYHHLVMEQASSLQSKSRVSIYIRGQAKRCGPRA